MSSGASALFSHKLTDFTPWNQESEGDLSGQLVLFLDDSLLTSYHHSGSFAMDSLLLKYCRSPEHRVVLLLSSQSGTHYQSILMKNVRKYDSDLNYPYLSIARNYVVSVDRCSCYVRIGSFTMLPSRDGDVEKF